ncbi:triose-phosphate isomerase [Actinomadura hibisca]|uniref:triose-phosphate isomerase n=1 Tax=Actinomadura hibisca TaxID=68565 RepID=UPI00082AF737|nr:triose-phosphate isomerase family protein [Actinomadura hibisca]
MSFPVPPRPLTLTNTKQQLGRRDLDAWLAGVRRDAGRLSAAGFVALLPYTALEGAGRALAGTGVAYGAQNLWHDGRDCTGEVAPRTLADFGCTHVMVGHAERRRVFGEDDATVAAKAAAAAEAALIPVVCVGETEQITPPRAATTAVGQLAPALDRMPDDAPLIVLYEPAWTIGADAPADAAHVATVTGALRRLCDERSGPARLLYGGAVEPGTYRAMVPHAPLDGVALGHAALDADQRARIADEVLVHTPS